MKKYFILISTVLLFSVNAGYAINMLSDPVMFNSDMEQHGAFIAEDLRTSPLLRSMFNLSVNEVNADFVRICLNQDNQCKVVKRGDKVYLVASGGKAQFDQIN